MRRCPCESEGIFVNGLYSWRGSESRTLFPMVLDDLVPADRVCRVIDVLVDSLAMGELGFERSEAARRAVLAIIRAIC